MQPLLKQPYRRGENKRKGEDIKKAYKQIFGEDLTHKEVVELTKGERDKDMAAIILSMLSYRHNISFESLKKSFYKASRKLSQVIKLGDIRCHLSRILGDRRISQRELAKKSGLSTYTINKFYNKKWQGVDRETLIKLCETLGVQVGDLFEYVETEEKSKKLKR